MDENAGRWWKRRRGRVAYRGFHLVHPDHCRRQATREAPCACPLSALCRLRPRSAATTARGRLRPVRVLRRPGGAIARAHLAGAVQSQFLASLMARSTYAGAKEHHIPRTSARPSPGAHARGRRRGRFSATDRRSWHPAACGAWQELRRRARKTAPTPDEGARKAGWFSSPAPLAERRVDLLHRHPALERLGVAGARRSPRTVAVDGRSPAGGGQGEARRQLRRRARRRRAAATRTRSADQRSGGGRRASARARGRAVLIDNCSDFLPERGRRPPSCEGGIGAGFEQQARWARDRSAPR